MQVKGCLARLEFCWRFQGCWLVCRMWDELSRAQSAEKRFVGATNRGAFDQSKYHMHGASRGAVPGNDSAVVQQRVSSFERARLGSNPRLPPFDGPNRDMMASLSFEPEPELEPGEGKPKMGPPPAARDGICPTSRSVFYQPPLLLNPIHSSTVSSLTDGRM
ncbi:hypothetical protein BKA67DRAFT_540698 [Truncatella angustata]|uniref:Uncharacterized protein n=1 Tax=Truncatella angustata TaxID=152316 RepID=A0A9P8RK13_9PEZI|nr:uncharacterized protein BKA67DRAFT_540698 [Truncatella angustata]KAH6647249.1 hypothetical protein BKA67DRAFT_540698 [Truncatella angustata]